ncbi:MAG: acyltransferase family protein [Rhizobiales bacterium]|nr:acyltransferase family protein [Hyphomicrobiales bacterium]
MSNSGTISASPASERVDWVDYAKGICIVMVVMMHSTLGVEASAGKHGFMHVLVEFARPFRMPDFFLISGLFLARVINRDWRTYLDRKVVHFFYFYFLWVAIQFAFKAPSFAADHGWAHVGFLYLETFYEPFGTLWFIYMLPVFFVLTKATLRVPAPLIWLVAAALEMAHIQTGWTAIDEFAARFVYFYSGYLFANYVFRFASFVQAWPIIAGYLLAVWFVANSLLVLADLAIRPGISLALGMAGALAVIAVGALLAKMKWLDGLRFCGEHSIVIYLAFFLPMVVVRVVLLKLNILDVGLVSLIDTICGVLGALAICRFAMRTGLGFLFVRPQRYWIAPKQPRATLQAAE